MFPSYLTEQILERRRRLAALDDERAKLQGEIAAYEDVLANGGNNTDPDLRKSDDDERLLPISRAWLCILQRLASYTNFNASEIMLVAHTLYSEGALRKEQTHDGVRAQLSLYTKKGILKRIGGGNYRLTDTTKAALKLGIKTSLGQS